jgi:hypothetical protein
MLTDYPFADRLALPDRLRLLADALQDDPLDIATLHRAADLIEIAEREKPPPSDSAPADSPSS